MHSCKALRIEVTEKHQMTLKKKNAHVVLRMKKKRL